MDKKDAAKDNQKKPQIDLNDVEMVFGSPPATPKSGMKPDVHMITNERKHTGQVQGNGKKNGEIDGETTHPRQPLLEPDKERQQPPLAGPEIDDLDDERSTNTPGTYPGIDDGLLEPNNNKPDIHGLDGEKVDGDADEHHGLDEGVGTEDGKWPWTSHDEADYPYDGFNGLGTRFGLDDRPGSPLPATIPDVNTYQQKKNLAQGMMDLALLSANANQLRYVLESSQNHPYYYPSLAFISLSIVFQIAVGIGLIMNSRYNVKDDKDICKADKINNMTVLGIFLITIVNVFITSFSVANNVPNTTIAVQQAG